MIRDTHRWALRRPAASFERKRPWREYASPAFAPEIPAAEMRGDGLPAEHPESMALELAPADEVALAALSNDLWPADEYNEIVAEDYRRRNGGAS